MANRRKFISSSIASIAGITLLPAINNFAQGDNHYRRGSKGKIKLRFALASDLHYGQDGTNYAENAGNIVKWLNEEHFKKYLDLVIINGDLVHNRPDLLPEVKTKYFDHLAVPYHTIPGNHDFANGAIWKSVFGYDDKYTLIHGDIAFVFVNTADIKGTYVCPDNVFIKNELDKLTDKKIVFVILHIAPVQWLKTEEKVF